MKTARLTLTVHYDDAPADPAPILHNAVEHLRANGLLSDDESTVASVVAQVLTICVECDNDFDDNGSEPICRTCEDWI